MAATTRSPTCLLNGASASGGCRLGGLGALTQHQCFTTASTRTPAGPNDAAWPPPPPPPVTVPAPEPVVERAPAPASAPGALAPPRARPPLDLRRDPDGRARLTNIAKAVPRRILRMKNDLNATAVVTGYTTTRSEIQPDPRRRRAGRSYFVTGTASTRASRRLPRAPIWPTITHRRGQGGNRWPRSRHTVSGRIGAQAHSRTPRGLTRGRRPRSGAHRRRSSRSSRRPSRPLTTAALLPLASPCSLGCVPSPAERGGAASAILHPVVIWRRRRS
jgi:hypothetical protein